MPLILVPQHLSLWPLLGLTPALDKARPNSGREGACAERAKAEPECALQLPLLSRQNGLREGVRMSKNVKEIRWEGGLK